MTVKAIKAVKEGHSPKPTNVVFKQKLNITSISHKRLALPRTLDIDELAKTKATRASEPKCSENFEYQGCCPNPI